MQIIDLFSLREQFDQRQIVFCFNGPISTILIEEMGNALKNYMQKDTPPSLVMDVFGVYVELTQNIRHYSRKKNYNERDSSATVVIANDADEGHYLVLAGNLVERDDAQVLLNKCSQLAAMDKGELKTAYKKQLREPRITHATSGAGLGLLDIARKASRPLITNLTGAENGKVFFSLLAII
jgi:hypothetical protein